MRLTPPVLAPARAMILTQECTFMLLHIELWKPRERWLALAREEREAFISGLMPKMRTMIHAGIEIIGWGINDDDTPHRAEFPYFAVWRIPSRDSLAVIEGMVEAAGWHDYFEQVNVRGDIVLPNVIVGRLLTAGCRPQLVT